MTRFKIQVTQLVDLELDEGKFDAGFLDEFRRYQKLPLADIDDHAKHLGRMVAQGKLAWNSRFVEGYGRVKDHGILVPGEPQVVVTEIVERSAI